MSTFEGPLGKMNAPLSDSIVDEERARNGERSRAMVDGRCPDRPVLLFVAPYFPPACYGGVVQVYMGLLERLEGYDVVVVSDRRGCGAEEISLSDARMRRRLGLRVERIDAFDFHLEKRASVAGRLLRAVEKGFELVSFLRRGWRQWGELVERIRPDLIVCGGTYSAGWLMGCKTRGTPLVTYVHGEELTMKVAPAVLRPAMRRWQRRTIRRAELNVAVSSYTADLLIRLTKVDQSRVALLPNFVDTCRFRMSGRREETRARLGWSESFNVLTLARLEPRKGIDQALRALALLHERGQLPRGWRYGIAGRGQEEGRLRSLSEELGLGEHVEFLGFVKDEEVASLYEAADLFLQPNREIDGDTEGFGIVFLEASACGVAVIGGVAGGTADAIAEGVSGYRVDGESVTEIADAIERLANNGVLRERLGAQGAAMVASGFGVEEASLRFSALLEGVMKGRGDRAR